MKLKQIFAVGLIVMTTVGVKASDGEQENAGNGINNVFPQGNGFYLSLAVRKIDPAGAKGGIRRSPVNVPPVYIENHTVYFNGNSFDEVLLIVKDGENDETVVYSSAIPAGADCVRLPAEIAGVYELRLCRGGYCFYGDVEL